MLAVIISLLVIGLLIDIIGITMIGSKNEKISFKGGIISFIGVFLFFISVVLNSCYNIFVN